MFFLFLACVSTSSSEKNTDSLLLQPCDHSDWPLSQTAKDALMSAGMTQCMMPFDIVIAADQNIPQTYTKMVSTIVSEMVDADRDGLADDRAVVEKLQNATSAWLAIPMEEESWENQQRPLLEEVLGYDLIVPMWWMAEDTPPAIPNAHAKAVMVEEVTHFFTQFGWSSAYPTQFGVENWDSIVAQETQRAACDWWQHPENSCPDQPAEYAGDCADPSCDVVEFYHQVLIVRAGMTPGWFGIGFPETAEALEEQLSAEMKAVMDDPQFHQRKTPLRFSYP